MASDEHARTCEHCGQEIAPGERAVEGVVAERDEEGRETYTVVLLHPEHQEAWAGGQ